GVRARAMSHESRNSGRLVIGDNGLPKNHNSTQEVRMSDESYVVTTKAPGGLIGVSVAGLVLALCSLGWALGLQNHLQVAQQGLATADQRNQALADKLEQTNDRMRAQGE